VSGEAALWFVGGVALGFLVASFLISPGTSDRLVAQGVRDKVQSKLGSDAVAVGDALNIWPYTVGLAGLTQ